MNPENSSRRSKNIASGGMVRMLGVQQRNEVRATQNLAIIVLFFMICWIPLYTINCIIAFYKDFKINSTFMLACIILSHLNSAGNPLLYAYHLRDFRAALKNFFCSLFHLEQDYCEQFPGRYPSNYSQYRNPYRNSSSNLEVQKRYTPQSKVEVIVKNSAVLAAAPTGNIHRSIWNITEDSGRDSGSSPDSLRDLDSCRPKKFLMMKKTPTLDSPKLLNHAYVDSSSMDDSDDVFMDDSLPYYREMDETCLTDTLKSCPMEIPVLDTSTSSFHTTKPVFVIEHKEKHKNQKKELLNVVRSPKGGRISPYKFVSGILKGRRKLKRSLSDGGSRSESLRQANGPVVADYFSVPI